MLDLILICKNAYTMFSFQAVSMALIWLAMIYWMVKGPTRRKGLTGYLFFVIAVFISGIMLWLSRKRGMQDGTYWFIYLLVPTTAVYAACVSDIVKSEADKRKKVIFFLCACLLVQMSTIFDYTGENLLLFRDNREKESEIQAIHDECISIDNRRIIAPEAVASEIKEIDTQVNVIYGESYDIPTDDNLEKMIFNGEYYGCTCLIVDREYDDAEYLKQQGGYEQVYETAHYIMYVR